MKGLSKSRYTAFCQCPKNLWLKVFEPEKATKTMRLKPASSVLRENSLFRT